MTRPPAWRHTWTRGPTANKPAPSCSPRARRGSDPECLQRIVVLAHFVERPLPADEFARALRDLSVDAAHGRPGVAAAARAILADWQAQVAQSA